MWLSTSVLYETFEEIEVVLISLTVLWGLFDRLHETGQFELTTDWNKSFDSRKERADELTCK